MDSSKVASRVAVLGDVDQTAFESAVEAEGERLKAAIRAGHFDNPEATVGLEYECYAADSRGRLTAFPRSLLGLTGVEKEIGTHQVELHTSPQPLCRHALGAQEHELRTRLDAVLRRTAPEGIRVVSDGTWTVPSADQTATEYFTDSVERDGVTLPANMSDCVRYYAQENVYDAAACLDVPNASCDADTVLLNSLTTSIQPHYQVPSAADLPEYFRYALRVAGPLLALAANSPFLPTGFYDADAETVLADCHAECRIGVFEGVMNARSGPPKVRFPRDLDSVTDAVDRVVEDPVVAPLRFERGDGFGAQFRHFQHKHGTYWRWVRPVFDGATREAASARVEFRPLPGQPTVRDTVGLLAVVAGLLSSLPRRGHPVGDMDWTTARENFYAAAQDGLAADLTWVTAEGDETNDTDELYADLFEHARDGLERQGVDEDRVRTYLAPLESRVERRTTPARWKQRQVRRHVDDGSSLADAVRQVQGTYVRRQTETLVDGTFPEWFEADRRSAPPQRVERANTASNR